MVISEFLEKFRSILISFYLLFHHLCIIYIYACADYIKNTRDLQVKSYSRPLKIRVYYIIVLGMLILLFSNRYDLCDWWKIKYTHNTISLLQKLVLHYYSFFGSLSESKHICITRVYNIRSVYNCVQHNALQEIIYNIPRALFSKGNIFRERLPQPNKSYVREFHFVFLRLSVSPFVSLSRSLSLTCSISLALFFPAVTTTSLHRPDPFPASLSKYVSVA